MPKRLLACCIASVGFLILGAEATVLVAEEGVGPSSIAQRFRSEVEPFLTEFCFDCHNQDNMESGIRVDVLDGSLEGRTPFLWKNIRKQLSEQAMPPEGEVQPTAERRQRICDWIDDGLVVARHRKRDKNGSVRRLTVAQYQNTLRQLLGIKEDYTSLLPPDAVSKDGFLNNEQEMILSPLLIEAYFDVATKALDTCVVDPAKQPTIQRLAMEFGKSINPTPCPDELILGPNNLLLNNEDFVVRELQPVKPFAYTPFRMQTKYRFFEGYQGNATVRGWRRYDSIYHAVYACMRGDKGYPKGDAYSVIPQGLVLRPAIPNVGLFGVSTTYGPKANFKVSLRQLPKHGNLRVTVSAARYDDGLLLDAGTPAAPTGSRSIIADLSNTAEANVEIEHAGLYQVDVAHKPSEEPQRIEITLDDRHFSGKLQHAGEPLAEEHTTTAFMVVRLTEGQLRLTAQYGDAARLASVVLTRVDEDSEAGRRFAAFDRRSPILGAYLGLRRDCGSTQSPFGMRQVVASLAPRDFVFEDAINNHPRPEVPDSNDNYLAGLREVGVRSEYTNGRDMPRLLIKSVQLEGPYYESWPPASHQAIFGEGRGFQDPQARASRIIRTFATRAFRRPVTDEAAAAIMKVWRDANAHGEPFHESIKDALTVVLTSPQFLFLIENSSTPDAEPLDDYELASKLSYLLWNSPPDHPLLDLAEANTLQRQLNESVKRMIYDERFAGFTEQFVSQWLALNKLAEIEVDRKLYPQLSRTVRAQLRSEPIALVQHAIRKNLPIAQLLRSDFIMANGVVADYYGLPPVDCGFDFTPVTHGTSHLGGLLSQAGILVGLSDGRESNPVKRGAWLARKIIAEPPDDPPPNVPDLEEDGQERTLRERLERHRNQPGCAKCHQGIDPWGLPLEAYDAGGLLKAETDVDASSVLPDNTEVQDANALKDYLADEHIDQVAFSFLKHLATYAVGRKLAYSEIELLRAKGLELSGSRYRMQDLLWAVIDSPLFLEK